MGPILQEAPVENCILSMGHLYQSVVEFNRLGLSKQDDRLTSTATSLFHIHFIQHDKYCSLAPEAKCLWRTSIIFLSRTNTSALQSLATFNRSPLPIPSRPPTIHRHGCPVQQPLSRHTHTSNKLLHPIPYSASSLTIYVQDNAERDIVGPHRKLFMETTCEIRIGPTTSTSNYLPSGAFPSVPPTPCIHPLAVPPY